MLYALPPFRYCLRYCLGGLGQSLRQPLSAPRYRLHPVSAISYHSSAIAYPIPAISYPCSCTQAPLSPTVRFSPGIRALVLPSVRYWHTG
eukprot:557380-Rhodomonas_salina.1